MKATFITYILLLNVLFYGSLPVAAQTYSGDSLTLHLKEGSLTSLENKASGTRWQTAESALYRISASGGTPEVKLAVQETAGGQLELSLSLTNRGSKPVMVDPNFPVINDLAPEGTKGEDLYYLFPRQGALTGNADKKYDAIYSSRFPLQFIDTYHTTAGGIYVMTCDTTNYPKRYYMTKENGKVSLRIRYRSRSIAPGETWILPSVIIGAHKGDWHEAFAAYKSWVRSWYVPLTPRKEWFQDIYNFRQVFLHRIFGENGAFDSVTKKIDIVRKIKDDQKAFGGVDYVHLFDWGETVESGRLGDYSPWKRLGGKEQLQEQIRLLNRSGIPVGIYHNGYRINTRSTIGREKAEAWQQVKKDGGFYTEGKYYTVCPLEPEWKQYLLSTLKRTTEETGAQGIYIDRFGFGWQYGCHHPAHHHDIRKTSFSSEIQVAAEAELMKEIKTAFPDKVTYTEEMLTDVSTQYQDGSFTYNIRTSRKPGSNNPSGLNLPRFALPGFKFFELFQVDDPFGNDADAVRRTFFNGEGLWLEGPLSDPAWFPEDVRAVIRKTYAILSRNKDAFRSEDAVPIVPVLVNDVYANLFPSEHKNVWTFYNAGKKKINQKVISVPHRTGAVYYDEWNGKLIKPEIKDGRAIVKMAIADGNVGCLVQSWE